MQEIKQLLPVSWLAVTPYKLAHPLRSSPITGPSSLLQDDPPPSCASILSPFVVLTYRVFSYHHRKGSHVPHKSLNQGHATFMPDAARSVSRPLPCWSRNQRRTPVLTSTLYCFDTSSVVCLRSSPWSTPATVWCRDFS